MPAQPDVFALAELVAATPIAAARIRAVLVPADVGVTPDTVSSANVAIGRESAAASPLVTK